MNIAPQPLIDLTGGRGCIPPGHISALPPAISTATEAAIRKALKKGDTGIRKIAAALGVGTGTVQRIKAEMSSA